MFEVKEFGNFKLTVASQTYNQRNLYPCFAELQQNRIAAPVVVAADFPHMMPLHRLFAATFFSPKRQTKYPLLSPALRIMPFLTSTVVILNSSLGGFFQPKKGWFSKYVASAWFVRFKNSNAAKTPWDICGGCNSIMSIVQYDTVAAATYLIFWGKKAAR